MRFIGLDPSTKTGFVALDADGNTLRAKELTGIGEKDPVRMITMIDDIMRHIQKDDFVVIEGFGFATQRGIQLGGIGWGIRMSLTRRGIKYIDVAPNALKKFVNVTGWTGEKGSKVKLKGKENKQAVMNAVYKHFGFIHKSDNVCDAYVLAQIALGLKEGPVVLGIHYPYQLEVLNTIQNPPEKKAKK